MPSKADTRPAGKVTSLEVAERAGVSRSAVSRVFTPGASVSEKTAEKVRRAADELGYRPNVLARSLMTGRSRMIGLLVAYLDNHFYPIVLEQLSSALQARGYHVLVFMASQADPDLDRVAEEILDYQVDGMILASVAMTSDIAARCEASGVPVVLFNRRQGEVGELAVVSDNYAGGRMVAEHLLGLGRTRIAHIAGWSGASTQADREAGFLDGLRAAGATLSARDIGDFRPELAQAAARRMFAGPDRPDAVFVSNDYMAFVVMDVLRSELGLDVPGDVAVASFDDVPTSSWPSYDLTSVRQDASAMVAAATDLIVAKIEGRTAVAPKPLPVELVVRGSTVG
ncbi:MAG: LacI family DNA-binding transcriptional regulator [Pseudomonadota bacterium]